MILVFLFSIHYIGRTDNIYNYHKAAGKKKKKRNHKGQIVGLVGLGPSLAQLITFNLKSNLDRYTDTFQFSYISLTTQVHLFMTTINE